MRKRECLYCGVRFERRWPGDYCSRGCANRAHSKPTPVECDGDVCRLVLSDGSVAVVEAADRAIVEGFLWRRDKGGYIFRMIRTTPARRVSLHRAILDAPAGLDVDHIDHDPLNNRRANLRLATEEQSTRNTRGWANRTNRYKGVRFRGNFWNARIRVNYRLLNLGSFATEEEAARAYDRAALEHFGAFAALNFPTPQSSPAVR